MPLYEYKCLGCGHQFELLMLHASPQPACPACSAESVERLLSQFAVSSAASQAASKSAAYTHNNTLDSKQEPDKARIQIEHKHQHSRHLAQSASSSP